MSPLPSMLLCTAAGVLLVRTKRAAVVFARQPINQSVHTTNHINSLRGDDRDRMQISPNGSRRTREPLVSLLECESSFMSDKTPAICICRSTSLRVFRCNEQPRSRSTKDFPFWILYYSEFRTMVHAKISFCTIAIGQFERFIIFMMIF